jgi:hypothetical protein
MEGSPREALQPPDRLCSADQGERMRQLLQAGLQMPIDAEAEQHIGAARHERIPTRTTQRNGSRERLVTRRRGVVRVGIPKTRTGESAARKVTGNDKHRRTGCDGAATMDLTLGGPLESSSSCRTTSTTD